MESQEVKAEWYEEVGAVENYKSAFTPLIAPPKPRKLFAFDIETQDKNRNFLCGSIVGEGYEQKFRSRAEIQKALITDNRFRCSWIFATNLGFDLPAICKDGQDLLEKFEVIPRGSDFILATTYQNNKPEFKFYNPAYIRSLDKYERKNFHKVSFADTLNHYRASVEQLGKIVGIEKMPQPERIGFRPKTKSEWEYMEAYNLQDSKITYEFAKWIQSMYNELGASLKFTAPSTAIDLFRRKYLGQYWFRPVRENIIQSYKPYYGGRTEAFQRGHFLAENYGNIFVYDVNSLYPYVMKEFDYPMPWKYRNVKHLTLDEVEGNKGFGYFEMLAPKDMYIPIIPVKTDKLRFPEGVIKGWYDFATIKLALKYGYEVLSFGEGTVYPESFRPFKGYVDDLYKRRGDFKMQKSKAEVICKLMLNSLYGKWGQRYDNKEQLVAANTLFNGSELMRRGYKIEMYKTKPNSWIPDIYKLITTDESKIAPYIYPALSTYITAYARNHLFELFRRIGEQRVLYADTDSIFTTRVMPTSNDLGDIKLEKTFEDLLIVKAKMYAGRELEGNELIKIKGVMRPKKPEDTYGIRYYQDLLDMANRGYVEAKNWGFTKFRSGLQEGKYINQPYEISKTMGLEDDKRIWEGIFTMKPQDSKPIRLSESSYS